MASLHNRNGYIHISYYKNNTHFRYSLKLRATHNGRKKAKEVKKKIEAEILQDYLLELTNKDKPRLLLSEGLKKFCEYKSISYNSNHFYGLKYLIELYGDLKIDQISDIYGAKLKNYLLDIKSHNTTASYLRHLRVLFNFFIRQDYIKYNPIPKIKTEDKPIITIPEDHLKKILNYLNDAYTMGYHLIKLLLMTGFRISEVLSLTQQSINFNDNVILVHNKKANRNEAFPIYKKLKPLLKDILRYNESDKIFNINRFEALSIFQDACKECNVPKYRIHDLRRTFASKYATVLTPIELKKLVRHADINTTLKSYVNIDLQDIGKKL